MNYELETDMKGAKLLGHNMKALCGKCRCAFPSDWDACPNIECGDYDSISYTLSLSDSATQMAVLQKLGEIYLVSIIMVNGAWSIDVCLNGKRLVKTDYLQSERAVRVAVNSVEANK